MDLSFRLAVAPDLGQTSLHRLQVLLQSRSKATQPPKSLFLRQCDPCFQLLTSPFTNHHGEGLGQLIGRCHHLIETAWSSAKYPCWSFVSLGRTTEEQTGHVASRWHRCCPLTCHGASWTTSRFITAQLGDEPADYGRGVWVALFPDLAPQFHSIMAAFIPTLE